MRLTTPVTAFAAPWSLQRADLLQPASLHGACSKLMSVGIPSTSVICWCMQMRGSIPLYWHQEGGARLKPDILVQHYDPLYYATRLHFQVQFSPFEWRNSYKYRYGRCSCSDASHEARHAHLYLCVWVLKTPQASSFRDAPTHWSPASSLMAIEAVSTLFEQV